MLLDGLEIGGTEFSTLELARSLVKMGDVVGVVSAGGPLEDSYRGVGAEVIPVQEIRSGKSKEEQAAGVSSVAKGLAELVRNRGYQIINSQTPFWAAAGALVSRMAGIPFVVSVRGIYYSRKDLAENRAWVDRFIFNSPSLMEWATALVPANKSLVIPSGIDPTPFNAPLDQVAHGVSPAPWMNRSDNSPLVVFAGRLEGRKGRIAVMLLAALEHLARKGLNLRCILVGPGATREIRQKQATINKISNDRLVNLKGGVSQASLGAWFQRADLVVGSGRVAAEAIIAGCPVLAVGEAGHYGLVGKGRVEEANRTFFGDHGAPFPATVTRIYESLVEFTAGRSQKWCPYPHERLLLIRRHSPGQVALATRAVYWQILESSVRGPSSR